MPLTSSTSSMHGHSTTESFSFRLLEPANVLREMKPGQGVLVYGHLAPTQIAAAPLDQDRPPPPAQPESQVQCRGGGTVSAILEDLTMLSSKRLEKRLETLARDALPCRSVTVFEDGPELQVTVALHVDSRRRGDVLDLARVVEDDAAVSASCGWSLLAPSRRQSCWRLLFRVSFELSASCGAP